MSHTRFVIAFHLALCVVPFRPLAPASAATSGPRAPSQCHDDASMGSVAWNFPERATASDDRRAVRTMQRQQTHYLVCAGFGFSIPETDTIIGILVDNEVSVGGADEIVYDFAQRIVRSGIIGTAERVQPAYWPRQEGILRHGASTDTWGECWCALPPGAVCDDSRCGNVNSDDFGAAISANHVSGNGGTARVDQVRITIFHEPSTPVPTPIASAAYTPPPTSTATPTPSPNVAGCPPQPLGDCRQASRSTLRIRHNHAPQRRRLDWRWQGEGPAGFGDPRVDANYVMCVYDDDSLAAELRTKAADVCSHGACWKSNLRGGFSYRNRDTNQDGVRTITLSGDDLAARLDVQASGENMILPMPFAQNEAVTVQILVDDATGRDCWEARYAPPARRRGGEEFDDLYP